MKEKEIEFRGVRDERDDYKKRCARLERHIIQMHDSHHEHRQLVDAARHEVENPKAGGAAMLQTSELELQLREKEHQLRALRQGAGDSEAGAAAHAHSEMIKQQLHDLLKAVDPLYMPRLLVNKNNPLNVVQYGAGCGTANMNVGNANGYATDQTRDGSVTPPTLVNGEIGNAGQAKMNASAPAFQYSALTPRTAMEQQLRTQDTTTGQKLGTFTNMKPLIGLPAAQQQQGGAQSPPYTGRGGMHV